MNLNWVYNDFLSFQGESIGGKKESSSIAPRCLHFLKCFRPNDKIWRFSVKNTLKISRAQYRMWLFKEREKCVSVAVLFNVNFSQQAAEISVNLPSSWKAISKYWQNFWANQPLVFPSLAAFVNFNLSAAGYEWKWYHGLGACRTQKVFFSNVKTTDKKSLYPLKYSQYFFNIHFRSAFFLR